MAVAKWIPGSRFARPGMTAVTDRASHQIAANIAASALEAQAS